MNGTAPKMLGWHVVGLSWAVCSAAHGVVCVLLAASMHGRSSGGAVHSAPPLRYR